MKTMRYILVVICMGLVSTSAFSQEEDKEGRKNLRRSVDLTWEANADLEDQKFPDAEVNYRRAIARSKENVSAPYNLGNAYYENNSLGEAFMRYKEAGEAAGTSAEKHKVFHNLGNVFMKNKEYQKAVEAYKEALRNDPTDEETRYNLALAKEMLEKEKQQNEQDQDDQDQQDNQDQQEQQNQDQQNQDQQNQDQQNQDQEGGDKEEEEQQGDPSENGQQKQEKEEQGEGDQQKEQPQQEQRQSQLSPQQIKNILEAMNNEEKKVQERMNAQKVKGVPVKTEKDW